MNSLDKKNGVFSIPTYVIMNHTEIYDFEKKDDFKNRKEFDVCIIADHSYWSSFKSAIKLAKYNNNEFVAICTNKHHFTTDYNKYRFLNAIFFAQSLNTKLLLGGWIGTDAMPVRVRKDLYWIDSISETHFIVVFRAFYDQILAENFSEKQFSFDTNLSGSTSNKLLIYPMISTENPNTKIRNPIDSKIMRIESRIDIINHLRLNISKS